MNPLPPDSDWAQRLRDAVERERAAASGAVPNAQSNGKTPAWPLPPRSEAFHGIAGDVANLLDPYTEADRAGVLLATLAAFGNAAGAGAHMLVPPTRHPGRIYVASVGPTGAGRKGTAQDVAWAVMERADPEWAQRRTMRGAVSGEGIIHHVRDPRSEQVPIYDGKGVDKQFVEWREEPVDPGVQDKRLLFIFEEFAAFLAASRREGNTLSSVLRLAWDGKVLETGAKNNPNRATGAHVSFITHITVEELRELMAQREVFNGFANRFLWLCVRRSKHLPEPEPIPTDLLAQLAGEMGDALEFARRVGRLQRDEEARAVWAHAYEHLGREREGLYGKACDRAQAQVLRLQLLFALLDCSPVVRVEHVRAALAVWEYAERSAAYIFRDAATSRTEQIARRILDELAGAGPDGLDRADLHTRVGRKLSASAFDAAFGLIEGAGLARKEVRDTGGRPAERWCLLAAGGFSPFSTLIAPPRDDDGGGR